MRRDLIRRLEKMEAQFAPPVEIVLRFVRGLPNFDKRRLRALVPYERIGAGVYRSWNDPFVLYRRRIIANPAAPGRQCEDHGYLEDVIREHHETWEYRNTADCNACRGLKLLFTLPEPKSDGIAYSSSDADAGRGQEVRNEKRSVAARGAIRASIHACRPDDLFLG